MAGIIIVFLCSVVLSNGIDIKSLKLEQVLILSRHNVRTPLAEELKTYSSQKWPKWNDSVGYLTRKGALLERFMGEYIAAWMDSENFIEKCPDKDDVLIYANTKQRTIATAEAFAESAFFNCNITVQHLKDLTIFDPLFLPILHKTDEEFKNVVRQEMQIKLDEVNLTESYLELSKIINLEQADICKKLFLCDLASRHSEIVTDNGEEPNVSGPLYIGNAIVDSFLMSYYEGMPISDVAWGQIATDHQWELLAKISRENQNVRFNLTTASKDIAGPLLKFMFDIFEKGTPKFTLLMGHDSNLNLVFNALGFKPFVLKHNFEPFPIGGKIVFQKWSDSFNCYLKVEYIYPSSSQLRFGERLSMTKPPQRVILKLKKCKASATGFCPWSDFMKLNDIYSS